MKMDQLPAALALAVTLMVIATAVFVNVTERKYAKDRAANPPSIEIWKASAYDAPFPAYVIHDRRTGQETTIVVLSKRQFLYVGRPGTWVLAGDEKFREVGQ